MIVVCTTCQARFKVADEKIGPRGAKVRCSKCQTVFVVHRELGVLPSEPAPPPPPPAPARPRRLELDLESEPMSGVRPSGFIADPFSIPAAAGPAPVDPFAGAAPAAPPPALGANHDPFGGADPFSASAAPAPSAGGSTFAGIDPFVATVAGAGPQLPTSAVTDLSDLIGGVGGPIGTPPPAAPSPAATPAPEPSGILETGFDFASDTPPSPELEVAPTPLPSPALTAPPGADLALAERTPTDGMAMGVGSIPMPGAADFGGVDLFGGEAGGMDGHLDFGGPDEDFAAAPPPPAPAAAPLAPAPLEIAAPAPVAAPPPAAPPPVVEPGPEAEAAASLRRRGSRLRAVLVNAISLVALIAVAIGILAFWRGLRPGAGGSLQPRALFGAIRGPAAPFSASQVRSGLFDRADAPPVLFVTGEAVSHAAAAVTGLRVRVELLRRGAVVARGEARAGAVPTSEQLYGSKDGAELAALLDGLARSAPAKVRPGDAVPFLVAIGDAPADVSGIGLRIEVEPIDAQKGAKGP